MFLNRKDIADCFRTGNISWHVSKQQIYHGVFQNRKDIAACFLTAKYIVACCSIAKILLHVSFQQRHCGVFPNSKDIVVCSFPTKISWHISKQQRYLNSKNSKTATQQKTANSKNF